MRERVGGGLRAAALGRAGACLWLVGVLASPSPARAADASSSSFSSSFAWAPAESPAVARGREVAARFDQASLWEISVEVDDAFSLENRRAVAAAEEQLRRVPGVRRVFGPARLVDIALDAGGKVGVGPILGPIFGRGAGAGEDQAARQRVVRRADALGWFFSADGQRVRFLIDAGPAGLAPLREPLGKAIASSGLRLLHAAGARLEGQALWPDPADRLARWLAIASGAGWILLVLVAGRPVHRAFGCLSSHASYALVVAGAAAGAGALFALSAVPAVRGVGLRAAVAAAMVAGLALALERPAGATTLAVRLSARPPGPWLLGAGALALLALALAPGLRIGTAQWRRAPFLFVSVRGDLDEPVVLREVRRLTDDLHGQPGVAGAWSIADLFSGVVPAGDDVGRIPDSAELARRILGDARGDPALALELEADHREALVVIRFDEGPGSRRLQLLEHLQRYLRTELRTTLVHVDMDRGDLSPVTRSFGQGLLAVDARDRILRACARAGRNLGGAERANVERIARRTALVPSADPRQLRREVAAAARAFFREQSYAGLGAAIVKPAERLKLIDELAAQSSDAPLEELRRVLDARIGSRLDDDARAGMAQALYSRLAPVRRRHTAAINFRAMLAGAELPAEGPLSDEVRAATLEAMGPLVGIPVSAGTPGAFHLDAMAVGGAANDRALSDDLRPGLGWGAAAGVALLAALLLVAGRGRGLLWLPVGLAPVAVTVIVASLARETVGMPSLSFMAGTLAGGAVLAVSLAARRTAV